MTMNGIDIADWQKNLNLDSIEYDFVIIKGTQGTNYVNTFCDAFVQKAIKAGKLWGFYHFMNMDDPVKQADHFYQNCKNYFGKVFPCSIMRTAAGSAQTVPRNSLIVSMRLLA